MTPKEMALNLFQKYDTLCRDHTKGVSIKDFAKECALIAVDEILSQDVFNYTSDWSNTIEYWQEVKEEIEKL